VPEDAIALRRDASAALGALLNAIKENHRDEEKLVARVVALQQLLERGTPVITALSSKSLADTLPLLSRILRRSMSASATARRALVLAMRAEGVSILAIARALGVSHQRISNILR